MKNRLLLIMICFSAVLSLIFIPVINNLNDKYSDDVIKTEIGYQSVMLNEITELTKQLQNNPDDVMLKEKLNNAVSEFNANQQNIAEDKQYFLKNTKNMFIIIWISCIVFAVVLYLYIYFSVIKPFKRLDEFAADIAAGKLDASLEIKRGNLFGAFAWAFDMMRLELKYAKENEEEALKSKKTLIATITHDIKTPVASIRAYSEALENTVTAENDRTRRYLDVIIKKSDEVARLTDDLFLHAISDMNKLSISLKEYSSVKLINEALDPFTAQYQSRLTIAATVPEATVITDAKRLEQVFENILTNAYKYAGTDVEIRFMLKQEYLECRIKDYGNGIPPEDLPFIFNKFYRGKNTAGENGSGLGLYIAKYIMDNTGGYIRLENYDHGLTAVLGIKLA